MRSWFKKILASGDLFIWGSAAGLATALLMVIGLVVLIGINGLGFFWTPDVLELTLDDGTRVIGELTGSEQIPDSVTPEHPQGQTRIQVKVGNRDLYGQDFRWIDEARIVTQTTPSDVVLLERREWGNMYVRIQAIYERDSPIATGGDAGWNALLPLIDKATLLHAHIRHIERDEIGSLSAASERERLKIRKLEFALPQGQKLQDANPERYAQLQATIHDAEAQYHTHIASLEKLYVDLDTHTAILIDSNGLETSLPIGKIIRALRPNAMSFSEKIWLYIVKVWEVLADEPREANTEGGLFPAIIGTVMMVLITSIVVVPFGVITALYLGEYARQGVLVKIVRIAINNLAGVPSIVLGIFGLGFFVYAVGGTIDTFFFAETLPSPTYGTGGLLWASLTLALLTVPVAIVATEEGLSAVPRDYREASVGLGATKFETI